jgi:hypothetical protein
MKKLLALFLIALAACYYMGFEPVDFIPSFASSTPPPKVRRPQAQPETSVPVPASEPAQRSGGSTVVAGKSDDGSLEHRWTPAKP